MQRAPTSLIIAIYNLVNYSYIQYLYGLLKLPGNYEFKFTICGHWRKLIYSLNRKKPPKCMADEVINFTYTRPAGFQMDSAHPARSLLLNYSRIIKGTESARMHCTRGSRGLWSNVLIDEDASACIYTSSGTPWKIGSSRFSTPSPPHPLPPAHSRRIPRGLAEAINQHKRCSLRYVRASATLHIVSS